MKTVENFNVKGKIVLVRCDFNVPLSEENEILDNFRIEKSFATIHYLIEEGAKVVLMSHLEGRDEKLVSLQYLIPYLERKLNTRVIFLEDYLKEGARKKIEECRPGELVLLENLRFHEGEKANEKEFAQKLASLGDIYINEAFSCSHRAHASIVGVPSFMEEKGAGLLLEKEVTTFSDLLEKPASPFIAIIGGIKVNTKIKAVLNILDIADHVILGSKLGEIIFAQKQIIVGRDFEEENLIDKLDLVNPKIHLPVDGKIALKDLTEEYYREGGIGTLRKEEDVYDIGPYSIRIFQQIIKSAKTILWNGTMGMHEDERFEKGTREIADTIVRNYSAFKVAGGGETVSALHEFNMADKFDFLSTGGGAMLHFLSGETLPGVEVLKE